MCVTYTIEQTYPTTNWAQPFKRKQKPDRLNSAKKSNLLHEHTNTTHVTIDKKKWEG